MPLLPVEEEEELELLAKEKEPDLPLLPVEEPDLPLLLEHAIEDLELVLVIPARSSAHCCNFFECSQYRKRTCVRSWHKIEIRFR